MTVLIYTLIHVSEDLFPPPSPMLMVWNLILLTWLSSSQVTSNCHLKLLAPNCYWGWKISTFFMLEYTDLQCCVISRCTARWFSYTYIKVSLVAQTVKNLPAMQETQVWSLGWEDPLENRISLLGEFHGQRSLVSYSPWDWKELDTTKQWTLSLPCVCRV